MGDFMQSLHGKDGTNGSNGHDGAQGPKGDTGPQGPQGPKGDPISTQLQVICVDPNGSSGKATLTIGAAACAGKTQLQVYIPTS